MLQTDIRLKLLESLNSRVEIMSKTHDKIQGKIEWVSPDGQMAEVRLGNGEIKTICDADIASVKRL